MITPIILLGPTSNFIKVWYEQETKEDGLNSNE